MIKLYVINITIIIIRLHMIIIYFLGMLVTPSPLTKRKTVLEKLSEVKMTETK